MSAPLVAPDATGQRGGRMRMDVEDRRAFAAAIEQVTSSLSGPELDAALADVGWQDALPDYPADAVPLLFESQGRARAATSGLDLVLAGAAGVDASCAALPVLSGVGAPGALAASGLDVRGLVTATARTAPTTLVVATAGDEHRAVLVDTSALPLQPVAGMDPSLGLSRVEATSIPESAYAVAGSVAWDEVVAGGQLALAHELIGLSRSMLEMAREHALAREQFGRPIASFQAVRHRLAEALVAIEAADAAAGAAWDSPGPLSSSMAKALAGRGARTVARHAQQVLAGMGFTAEHDFHLYFKRALVLDHLLGSSRRLTEELGRQLLATRELPPMLPL